MKSFLGAIATIASTAALATAQAASNPEASCRPDQSPLVILGMYHMSNPGLDAVNVEADDVLLPRRQAEIADLVNRLARFKPTKIAVEAPYRSTTVPERYKRYLAGEHQLSRDETEQIGFRLAKQLGLPGVTPIDFPMFMSGLVPSELDLAPRPDTAVRKETPAKPRELTAAEKLLRAHTVTEHLLYINSDSMTRRDHAGYFQGMKTPRAPQIYEATDPISNWYKRNLRMFANLNRETNIGKDRVLLLVGSGHLTILRHLAESAGYYCVIDPAAYLR